MADKCISCGMPMKSSKLRAAGKNDWCVYCGDEKGKLKDKKGIREQIIAYFMRTEKKSRFMAERCVDRHMKTLPAWNRKSTG